MVYLDYNATSPLRPEVKQAMLEVMGQPLNASSVHGQGRAARKILEESRRLILNYVNAPTLVFCSSGTEANNLALAQATGKIAVSAIEHDSVFKNPYQSLTIKVLPNGVVDLSHLREIASTPVFASIMLANNETGVIQPIKEAAEIIHATGGILHVDAVQAFGKIPVDFKNLGADLMTIACHKVGGPSGIAALVHRADLELKPILFGGGQEKNKRPGTENISTIVGFSHLANLFNSVSRETINSKSEIDLIKYLETEIKKIAPHAIIHGEGEERLPNTTLISMPGLESATQLIHFDTNNICVSYGSACSSGKVEVSRVLTAMNAPLARNAIRISTGWANTKDDIDKFLAVWKELYQRHNT